TPHQRNGHAHIRARRAAENRELLADCEARNHHDARLPAWGSCHAHVGPVAVPAPDGERFESLGWAAHIDPPKNSSAPRWAINPRVHELFQERAIAEAARKGKVKAAWQAMSAIEEK